MSDEQAARELAELDADFVALAATVGVVSAVEGMSTATASMSNTVAGNFAGSHKGTVGRSFEDLSIQGDTQA